MIEKYVPQIGDLVHGQDLPTGRGGQQTADGIYVGSVPARHDRGRNTGIPAYGILKSDGASVLMDTVKLIDAWRSNRLSYDNLAETAAEVLIDICLAFDSGPEAGTHALGYRDVARTREMPAEMAQWWEKARGPMMQHRFRAARVEMEESGRAVAEIRRLDGEPSVTLQEKYDAAQHKIGLYRERICVAYAAEIRAARAALRISIDPTDASKKFEPF